MKGFIRSRLKSFGFAGAGLLALIRSERNMWLHVAAALVVVIAGLFRGLGRTDWSLLIFAIGLVWVAEAFNTAIEKLCNHVTRDIHPTIKQVKDISAGAVLVSAIVAVIVGAFVFFVP